ncbi:MAG TPA: DMT family transporter [Pseudolabrys sp.]|nr:DMT family transporter [Pseudolabrys sp.]
MTSRKIVATAAPPLFVFLWSTGFIGAKYGLPYAEPLTFLTVRMAFVVVLMALIVAVSHVQWPTRAEVLHSVVTGSLVHGLYLGGVFIAISQGVPAGISALIPGLQPILASTIANRWLGERVVPLQWFGLALGLVGVVLVLHDRTILGAGSILGWIASFLSLIGIALGTLYQKRFGGRIDWRPGNLIQYIAALVWFALGAFFSETMVVHWTGEFVFAVAWLALMLSIGAVALMYWLIRRSAATGFASLFYLVPTVTALMAFALFGERLDTLSVIGMVICAVGVVVVNRAGKLRPAAPDAAESVTAES